MWLIQIDGYRMCCDAMLLFQLASQGLQAIEPPGHQHYIVAVRRTQFRKIDPETR